eukprot:scaffold41918_cov45-Attheya_sp.AAC.4
MSFRPRERAATTTRETNITISALLPLGVSISNITVPNTHVPFYVYLDREIYCHRCMQLQQGDVGYAGGRSSSSVPMSRWP